MAKDIEQSVPQTPAESATPEDNPALPGDRGITEWQSKLLPFMTYMVLGLTVFFFLASLVQLVFLHARIWAGTEEDPPDVVELVTLPEQASSEDMLVASRLKTLASLELYILERRYHQANVGLMSRVWVRYLGFVTGMTLALVGATFILGKLREPPSEVTGEIVAAKFSFAGTSPGILLVVVGVLLMGMTIVTHHRIDVVDKPVYTQPEQLYGGRSLVPSLLQVTPDPTSTKPPLFEPAPTATIEPPPSSPTSTVTTKPPLSVP